MISLVKMTIGKPSTDSRSKDTSPGDLWKQEILQSYATVSDLVHHRLISPTEAQDLEALGDQFKVRITPYYASLMSLDALCPIRKQALPHLGECDPTLPAWASRLSQEIYNRPTPWHPDPIGDVKNLAAPRLTHRYENRAILHLSSLCAVYCRFCFRKAQLNQLERTLYEGSLDPALQYLQEHTEIRELILTGGDPLSVTDSVIQRLFKQIAQVRHIRTVRLHSRMAVTLPHRFTPSLIELLSQDWGFQVTLVSHFNHPQELTFEARSALKALRKSGITLLNQTVLLSGVNCLTFGSSSECLQSLFQELYEIGVIPLYLHHPDWTPGTFHFRMSIEKGKELFSQLKGALPGPALPQYVLDIPQGYGKTSILDSRFRKLKDLSPTQPNDPTSSLQPNLGGAIYEVIAPMTRAGTNSTHLYLDLFPT